MAQNDGLNIRKGAAMGAKQESPVKGQTFISSLSTESRGSRSGCYCNHPPLVNSKRETGKRVTKTNLHRD